MASSTGYPERTASGQFFEVTFPIAVQHRADFLASLSCFVMQHQVAGNQLQG